MAMGPWLFRKEISFIGNPDVVTRNSEKDYLGQVRSNREVFVIDLRSKSLGKSTALNGSWPQSVFYRRNLLLAFCYIAPFYGVFRRFNFQIRIVTQMYGKDIVYI